MPLALTDAEASARSARGAALEALRAALAAVAASERDAGRRPAPGRRGRGVERLPALLPVLDGSGRRLGRPAAPHLEAVRDAQTRAAQADALRVLVADVRDGHGFVADTLDKTERGTLPVGLALVEGRLAVVSSATAEVPVGAVVTTIDGVPAADRLARETALASGTTQWRQARRRLGRSRAARRVRA